MRDRSFHLPKAPPASTTGSPSISKASRPAGLCQGNRPGPPPTCAIQHTGTVHLQPPQRRIDPRRCTQHACLPMKPTVDTPQTTQHQSICEPPPKRHLRWTTRSQARCKPSPPIWRRLRKPRGGQLPHPSDSSCEGWGCRISCLRHMQHIPPIALARLGTGAGADAGGEAGGGSTGSRQ